MDLNRLKNHKSVVRSIDHSQIIIEPRHCEEPKIKNVGLGGNIDEAISLHKSQVVQGDRHVEKQRGLSVVVDTPRDDELSNKAISFFYGWVLIATQEEWVMVD